MRCVFFLNIIFVVSFVVNIECIYKGERYASGAEWSDADDPCASFKCVAGVVTESNMQCYTPCNNPLSPRPGQCCSTCLGWLDVYLSFLLLYILFYFIFNRFVSFNCKIKETFQQNGFLLVINDIFSGSKITIHIVGSLLLGYVEFGSHIKMI